MYEDNAPHGLDDLYFLAGLITYMAIFEEKAPENYIVQIELNSDIASSYSQVVDYIWNYLLAFNDTSGNSRVFTFNPPTSDMDGDGIDDCPSVANSGQEDEDGNNIGDACENIVVGAELLDGTLYIDNPNGLLLKGQDGNCYLIFVDQNGVLKHIQKACPE